MKNQTTSIYYRLSKLDSISWVKKGSWWSFLKRKINKKDIFLHYIIFQFHWFTFCCCEGVRAQNALHSLRAFLSDVFRHFQREHSPFPQRIDVSGVLLVSAYQQYDYVLIICFPSFLRNISMRLQCTLKDLKEQKKINIFSNKHPVTRQGPGLHRYQRRSFACS